MFGTGCDQADGLKRWFSPEPEDHLELISVNADETVVALARHIDRTMISLGIAAKWDDPAGLLINQMDRQVAATKPNLLVSARRAGKPGPGANKSSLATLFTAQPGPDALPSLYGAIKSATELDREVPITVVWSHRATGSNGLQQLCEDNLAGAAMRFLGRSLSYLHVPSGWLDSAGSGGTPNDCTAPLFQPLAELIQSRLSHSFPQMPTLYS